MNLLFPIFGGVFGNGKVLVGCAVTDAHEMPFNTDVFVEIVPMNADVAAAQYVTL